MTNKASNKATNARQSTRSHAFLSAGRAGVLYTQIMQADMASMSLGPSVLCMYVNHLCYHDSST